MVIIPTLIPFFLMLLQSKLIEFATSTDPNLVLGIDTSLKIPMLVSKKFQRSLSNLCSFAQLRKIHKNYFEIFFCGVKLCADPLKNRTGDPGLNSENEVLIVTKNETPEMNLKLCYAKEHSTTFQLVPLSDDKYVIEKDGLCITNVVNKLQMTECTHSKDQIFKIRSGYEERNDLTVMTKSERNKAMYEEMNKNEETFRNESKRATGLV